MNLFLMLAFVFCIGSVVGWCIEVIFRRFYSVHHWVNPGFLVGPYLPLYGCSLCILYMLSSLEPFIPITYAGVRKLVLFVFMALAITVLEYVAGMIFIKGMKIKLWDYSEMWGNIQGIICPLFSLFWMLLSAVYYFFLHPYIVTALHWLSENLVFSFGIGFFYGIFVIDLAYSTRLMVKIRQFAEETHIVVRLEELREDVHDHLQNRKIFHFIFSTRGDLPLRELLEKYVVHHFPKEWRGFLKKKEEKTQETSDQI